MDILQGKKLELEYPCAWEYRLVGKCEESIKDAITNLAGEKPFSLKPSNKSSGGKFVSIIFEVHVYSEDERLYLYEELRKQKDILYVL